MTPETFDPRPAQFPDAIHARAPRGYRERIKLAAAAERIPVAEFIRRALADRIAAVTGGPANDDGPGPFRPAPGLREAA